MITTVPVRDDDWNCAFGSNGRASGVAVQWSDARHLVIAVTDCSTLSRRDLSYRDVQIVYRTACEGPDWPPPTVSPSSP